MNAKLKLLICGAILIALVGIVNASTTLYLTGNEAKQPFPIILQQTDDLQVREIVYPTAHLMSATNKSPRLDAGAFFNHFINSPHYTKYYGVFISEPLEDQMVDGTVTVKLSMAVGSTKYYNYPRIKLYKWNADNTFGGDLYLGISTSKVGTKYTEKTYFDSVSINPTEFNTGDKIAIEIETKDESLINVIQGEGMIVGGQTKYTQSEIIFSDNLLISGG